MRPSWRQDPQGLWAHLITCAVHPSPNQSACGVHQFLITLALCCTATQCSPDTTPLINGISPIGTVCATLHHHMQEEKPASDTAAANLDMDLDFGPPTQRKPARQTQAGSTQMRHTQAGNTQMPFTQAGTGYTGLSTPGPSTAVMGGAAGAGLMPTAPLLLPGLTAGHPTADALLTPVQLCLRLLQVCAMGHSVDSGWLLAALRQLVGIETPRGATCTVWALCGFLIIAGSCDVQHCSTQHQCSSRHWEGSSPSKLQAERMQTLGQTTASHAQGQCRGQMPAQPPPAAIAGIESS